MNTPFISIIVPVYNGEKTVRKCLASILNQDYPRDKYEIIVVDDGSQDETKGIAKGFGDKVVEHRKTLGLRHARKSGIKVAKGEIIVCVDSDVLIKPDTLDKIVNYFSDNREIDALTGMLSKEHPNTNFLSQYKNLYMNYIFSKLPQRITFLYGSIHAFRKEVAQLYDSGFDIGEDTSFGQKLISCGKKIAFLRDLEVIHLKKHSLFSFIKNDFQVPFYWARIFIKHKGWRQLGRNKTGFSHSPKEQLASIILAPAIFLTGIISLSGYFSIFLIIFSVLVWLFLNFRFFAFLLKEKRFLFGILASFVTFFDNIIMAAGILCGFCTILAVEKNNATK